jgi:molybdate transport system ATP-binding protein
MADQLIADIETRFRGGTVVSARLDVCIAPGSTLVLFGPSGAGKTTMLRAIAGLERPQRGRICWADSIWFDAGTNQWTEPQRRGVGYVSQDAVLFPHLTVAENVAYGLRRADRAARQRVAEVLALVDLPGVDDRRAGELSGGQTRRAAIARALAPAPRLLLLDEPLSGLDTPARLRLRAELRVAIARAGVAAVVVTHDRSEAIALGDVMAVLADGRVRQVGPVAEVFQRPADLVVAQSVGVESVIPARIARAHGGLLELTVGTSSILAVDAGVDPGRREVFACIRAEDVIVERDASSHGSARNHLPGRIVRIDRDDRVDRVTIDCGFPLTAVITRSAREELALEPGTSVIALVKATAVHLV